MQVHIKSDSGDKTSPRKNHRASHQLHKMRKMRKYAAENHLKRLMRALDGHGELTKCCNSGLLAVYVRV